MRKDVIYHGIVALLHGRAGSQDLPDKKPPVKFVPYHEVRARQAKFTSLLNEQKEHGPSRLEKFSAQEFLQKQTSEDAETIRGIYTALDGNSSLFVGIPLRLYAASSELQQPQLRPTDEGLLDVPAKITLLIASDSTDRKMRRDAAKTARSVVERFLQEREIKRYLAETKTIYQHAQAGPQHGISLSDRYNNVNIRIARIAPSPYRFLEPKGGNSKRPIHAIDIIPPTILGESTIHIRFVNQARGTIERIPGVQQLAIIEPYVSGPKANTPVVAKYAF